MTSEHGRSGDDAQAPTTDDAPTADRQGDETTVHPDGDGGTGRLDDPETFAPVVDAVVHDDSSGTA